MIRVLFIFLFISANCQEIINHKYWTVRTDSLDRPVAVMYRITQEMDTTNLGRKSFHGNTYFDFDEEYDGYDRAHTIPAASFDFDEEVQKEVADLKYVVPLLPILNRSLIKTVENYERRIAKILGCIIVLIEIKYLDEIKFNRKVLSCELEEIIQISYKN